ncbi:hyalin-like [Glandiceps talaboti]
MIHVVDVPDVFLECPNTPEVRDIDYGGLTAAVTFDFLAAWDYRGVYPITCVPASGSVFPMGETSVECSATGFSGNTKWCDFIVDVVDRTPPVPTCPYRLLVLYAETSGSGAEGRYPDMTGEDNSGLTPHVICEPPSRTVFFEGIIDIICEVSDDAGNRIYCEFTVWVRVPTWNIKELYFDCPRTPVVRDVDYGGLTAAVPFDFLAAWDVKGNYAIKCTPASDSIFPIGETPVECFATGYSGTTKWCDFIVDVVVDAKSD